MNWDAIGAIGEVSGAVAVVVTLIYLAGQLRQNTQALRSSTYEAINSSAFSWSDSVMDHVNEFAQIFQQTDLDQLTPEQHILIDTYAFKSFTVMESF